MKILLEFAPAFALIFLRSSNEKKFLLKSKLDVGGFCFDFCLDLMIFAQI